jgi:hypothetical protein
VIVSTALGLCEVASQPSLPAGFLVEGTGPPVCIVVLASTCEEQAGCNYLGGVTGGCFGLPEETNHLFEVVTPVAPGDCLYVSFIPA